MSQFYLKHKNEEKGPYTADELFKLRLSVNARVRKTNDTNYYFLHEIPELNELYTKAYRRQVRNLIYFISSIIIIFYIVFITISDFNFFRKKPVSKPIEYSKPLIDSIKRQKPVAPKPKQVSKTIPIREKKIITPIEPKTKLINSKLHSEIDLSSINARKKQIRNHFSDYIKTEKSTFSITDNGGISDINVVVENRSEFVIDRITIDIQYFNRDNPRTESYTFENMWPDREIGLKLPDVPNATGLNIIISRIQSVSLDFDYSPDKIKNTINDPFYKKWQ